MTIPFLNITKKCSKCGKFISERETEYNICLECWNKQWDDKEFADLEMDSE
jgi:formylmethanofuran dehydrogenase subunit E